MKIINKTAFILFSFIYLFSCKAGGGLTNEPDDRGGVADSNSVVTVTYEKSDATIYNPERGFTYNYHMLVGEQGEDLQFYQNLQRENVSLVQINYQLDEFKDRPLTQEQLNLMDQHMSIIRQSGMKAILLFAYCGYGVGTEPIMKEDATYDIVIKHLDQLQPFFQKNKDIIYVVQAGFIGLWGEWHHSFNGLDTPYYKKKILLKMLEVIPSEIFVSVRTPKNKQEIFDTEEPISKSQAFSSEPIARVAHHNHCLLSNATDYGTYVDVEKDKTYLSMESLFVPVGGETCVPYPEDYDNGCGFSRITMRRIRVTYLNYTWYIPNIDRWKREGCYEEFSKNLGYRIRLVKGTYDKKVKTGGKFTYDITLTNDGYAPIYHKKFVYLVFKNPDIAKHYEFLLPTEIRDCRPLAEYNIKGSVDIKDLEAGNYEISLKIADETPSLRSNSYYSIQLANKDVWTTKNGGMNRLNYNIKVEN